MITLLCAFGHIGSSVVPGLIGVALGLAVETLTGTESILLCGLAIEFLGL